MKLEEFRVKEYDGEFRVQRRFEEITGRRKKVKKIMWANVSHHGERPYSFHDIPIVEAMPPFDSLEEAREMIRIIVRGPIYHES